MIDNDKDSKLLTADEVLSTIKEDFRFTFSTQAWTLPKIESVISVIEIGWNARGEYELKNSQRQTELIAELEAEIERLKNGD